MPKTAAPRQRAKRPATRNVTHRPGTGKTAYEIVTQQIIEALEKGVVPWRQPWVNRNAPFPMSMATGKPYRGINVFLLATAALTEGYTSAWWGSLRQIRKLGGRIKDGEFRRPVLVILWKDRPQPADSRDEDEADTAARRPPLLRFYKVWNAEQCEGLPGTYQAPAPVEGTFAEHQPAEQVAKAYLTREPSLTLHHGGNRACWRRQPDEIHLPHRVQFDSPGLYYSVLFHEMTHSTAHQDRLNRKTDDYATSVHARGTEELTAEMGAAMLSAITGIEDAFDDSASYIGDWLTEIKGDPGLVIHAAARAQAAVLYILADSPRNEASTEPV